MWFFFRYIFFLTWHCCPLLFSFNKICSYNWFIRFYYSKINYSLCFIKVVDVQIGGSLFIGRRRDFGIWSFAATKHGEESRVKFLLLHFTLKAIIICYVIKFLLLYNVAYDVLLFDFMYFFWVHGIGQLAGGSDGAHISCGCGTEWSRPPLHDNFCCYHVMSRHDYKVIT